MNLPFGPRQGADKAGVAESITIEAAARAIFANILLSKAEQRPGEIIE